MSDETGFGAGGSTPLLQVEASHGKDCNTTDPGVTFSFELDSGLQQCSIIRPYTFSDYSGVIQPVTIMDAQGRAGGSSRVITSPVLTICLVSIRPTSTRPWKPPPAATPLPSTGSGAASTAISPSTRSSSVPTIARPSTESDAAPVAAGPHAPIAVIIGCASGALLLAALLVLGLLYLKRRRGWNFRPGFRGKFEAPTVAPYDYTPSTHSSAHKSTTHSFTPGSQHDANPPSVLHHLTRTIVSRRTHNARRTSMSHLNIIRLQIIILFLNHH
ncbi:hypothetical protein BD779DRAFT_1478427 [Infundibulicybe gibba]|nr:hypothetical protein BD779DRAFT_1478427 [Infundibulicybe gibba]